MATISLVPKLSFSDCGQALQFLFPNCKFRSTQVFHHRKCHGRRVGFSQNSGFRVFCQSKTEEIQIRKYSPFLESALLDGSGALVADEWPAVPDIWRTSAEKYGDRVALTDPYHDPPSNMTYKQLEQEILDFSEGLRIVGVKPAEKIALFADNSSRWLVADQALVNRNVSGHLRESWSCLMLMSEKNGVFMLVCQSAADSLNMMHVLLQFPVAQSLWKTFKEVRLELGLSRFM